MNPSWKSLASLRITVTILACSVLLVFFGTLAQVDEGLWKAQEIWFRSFLVTNQHLRLFGLRFLVPIFPGGYLIGYTLLVNLTAAFLMRFTWRWEKIGIHLVHSGVILLLLGQLLTDYLSNESHLRLKEGETRNFSEDHLKNELAFSTDAGDGKENVVVIPENIVKAGSEIKTDKLPFTVRVKGYEVNSQLRRRGPMVDGPAVATQGVGTGIVVTKQPEVKDMDSKNLPYAYIEIVKGAENLGTWLVTPWLDLLETGPQEFTVDGKKFRVDFRSERYYKPFAVTLIKATHEQYRGTDIPKNYKSRVRIADSASGEAREVDIYMNHPLRYGGLTFYQYQMSAPEVRADQRESTLQVVRNPGWLAPYAGCYVVALGMLFQFGFHLFKFLGKHLGKTFNLRGWELKTAYWIAGAAVVYAIFKFTLNLFGYNS